MFQNIVGEARSLQHAAALNDSIEEKMSLLYRASRLYISAIESAQDDAIMRTSLAYLALALAEEASRLKDFLRCFKEETRERNNLPRGQEMQVQDERLSLIGQRLVMRAHLQALKDLQNLPNHATAEPSAVQAMKDILTLEKQLGNLGIRRSPISDNKSVINEVALSRGNALSELGESFMILPEEARKLNLKDSYREKSNVRGQRLDYSMISLPPTKSSGLNTFTTVSEHRENLSLLWNINEVRSIVGDSLDISGISEALISEKNIPNKAHEENISKLLKEVAILREENSRLGEINNSILEDMNKFKKVCL